MSLSADSTDSSVRYSEYLSDLFRLSSARKLISSKLPIFDE